MYISDEMMEVIGMLRVRLGIDLGKCDRSHELAAYFDKRRLYVLGLFCHA